MQIVFICANIRMYQNIVKIWYSIYKTYTKTQSKIAHLRLGTNSIRITWLVSLVPGT